MGDNAYLVPIIVAIVAAIAGYLELLRRTSGKIKTTEAGRLWDASEKLRGDYVTEVRRLQDRLAQIEVRLDAVEAENLVLEEKNRDLEKKVEHLEKENTRLKSQNAAQHKRIQELENHVS